jgi:AcrR family transcriptional regulator
MPPRPKARLDDIVESATRIFSDKGYRRTLITDVASDLGIAAGTIYTYVESKDALFHLVVERASGVTTTPPTLPVPSPDPGETAKYCIQAFKRTARLAELNAALAREKADDIAEEVETIVRELYGMVARSRQLIRLVERSAIDLPELRTGFYVKGRRPFLNKIETYLDARIASGQLREVPDSAITARFIVESISWFANHRHGDQDSKGISDDAAEQVCVDMLVHGLIP